MPFWFLSLHLWNYFQYHLKFPLFIYSLFLDLAKSSGLSEINSLK